MDIIAQGLSKNFVSYKKKEGLLGSLTSFVKREAFVKNAVQSFDVEIESNSFVGLLGPNGAGKTTLMKMFTGIIVPSSGELKVIGFTPSERKIPFRKHLALIMGQKSQLWWDIPAMDSFLLLQKYYEVEDAEFKKKVGELSEMLGVKNELHTHVRKLSLGERMKVELMASLLHSPKILFLDEPTIGLDLVSQNKIRSFLKEYQKENKVTVILTSHYMADVQALCPRIILILKGQKAFDGPIQEFEQILGNKKGLSFNFKTTQDPSLEIWKNLEPVWENENKKVMLRIPEEKIREISSQILTDFDVIDFGTEKTPIENVMETLMHNPQILLKEEG
ncbi:MAG: ABC transporter ATP-binding protein [Bacteriovoracaceae bacterium]